MNQGSRYIEIEWPEFKVKVRARFLDDKNLTLCKFFWECLPIHILQSHAMVSGDTLLAFHPFTKEIPAEYFEDYLDEKYWGRVPANVGYVGFKTSGYQAIVIQWGPERTEFERRVPVAQVETEYLNKLAFLGQRVFEGMSKGEVTSILITQSK